MEKIIVIGCPGTIERLAFALMHGSSQSLAEIKKILVEDYGIEVKKADDLKQAIPQYMDKVLELKPEKLPSIEDVEMFVKSKQKNEQRKHWVVPKTIGKPCKSKVRKRK